MKKPAKIQDYFTLIYKPGHERAVAAGYVPEHILIAEKTVGRTLTPDEDVRHINGDTQDNRPSNLEIISTGNNYRSQSVDASHDPSVRKTNNKTFISCRYQRVCWKTVRAPIARANGVYLPYICSFQTEGDIYDCSHFFRFFEEEWALKKEQEEKGESNIDTSI